MSKYQNLSLEDLADYQEEDGSVRRFISCPDLTQNGGAERDHGAFLVPPDITDTDLGGLWDVLSNRVKIDERGKPVNVIEQRFTEVLIRLGARAMPPEILDQRTPVKPSTFNLPKPKKSM